MSTPHLRILVLGVPTKLTKDFWVSSFKAKSKVTPGILIMLSSSDCVIETPWLLTSLLISSLVIFESGK